jgi:hypothetical protein
MNKFFAFGFSLLLSAAAFAMPTVGDNALYAWTHTVGTKTSEGSSLRSIIAQNPATNGFVTRLTTELDGKRATNDQESTNLPTEQWITNLMANCAAYHGTLEAITVKAGTFQTCSTPVNSRGNTGRAWFALVSFGFVKSVVTDSKGNTDTLELQSFEFGKK